MEDDEVTAVRGPNKEEEPATAEGRDEPSENDDDKEVDAADDRAAYKEGERIGLPVLGSISLMLTGLFGATPSDEEDENGPPTAGSGECRADLRTLLLIEPLREMVGPRPQPASERGKDFRGEAERKRGNTRQ